MTRTLPETISQLPPLADRWTDTLSTARSVNGSADRALDLARGLGGRVPHPGSGRTAERWNLLAALGRIDLTAARVVEAHLDALAILAEAGPGRTGPLDHLIPADATWGVFAAEGPGARLEAVRSGSGWVLRGVKPWCSLADRLDAALVTAHVEGGRRLFAVPLDRSTCADADTSWVSRGLAEVTSGPVVFDDTPAVPVGATHWYLERPGFAWGGIGVAACWYGGATGLADRILDRSRRQPDNDLISLHLGAVDVAVAGARWALEHAARTVDLGSATPALLAARVRSVVAAAAEECLVRAGHALGPAPLTQDEDHARRVADLTVYVRQHHAERDLAALAADVREDSVPW